MPASEPRRSAREAAAASRFASAAAIGATSTVSTAW